MEFKGGYSPAAARFLIEAKAWRLFLEFMHGQTSSLNKYGEPILNGDDVNRFLSGLKSTARIID